MFWYFCHAFFVVCMFVVCVMCFFPPIYSFFFVFCVTSKQERMNESLALDGVGSLCMETSRLCRITQRWDASVHTRAFTERDASLILLLVGLCFGVLGLFLLILAERYKKINPQRHTVFTLSLLFTNLLQMLSSPMVAMVLRDYIYFVKLFFILLELWHASRRCGSILHLLVALEFIAIRKKLPDGTKSLPLAWSLSVVLALNLICILFVDVTEAAVALGALAMIVLLAIFILACCFSRHMDIRSCQVFCAAFFTFGITYVPSFMMECMIINKEPIALLTYDICLCLTNLRLVMDTYLCWVTCRETPEEAPQQVEARQGDLGTAF